VGIAIDDFGVGYSSLSYLRNFAVDTLKIDRSFVVNLADGTRDEAIVKAIISLAESLGLKVVAEGIESDFQLECLLNHPCDEAQGYLFSRPIPAEAFGRLLKERPRYFLPEQGTRLKRAHIK
jgi:EAL domain-containing protein (putative c-di-GMP-specific phosphodiesterase class I)